MNMPVLLVAQTIPLAGLVICRSKSDFTDLFTLFYFVSVGLVVSLIALLDDSLELTDWFGLAVDALAQ